MDSTSPSFEQPASAAPALGQALVERDGVLIHHGKTDTPVDVVAVMHEERRPGYPPAAINPHVTGRPFPALTLQDHDVARRAD